MESRRVVSSKNPLMFVFHVVVCRWLISESLGFSLSIRHKPTRGASKLLQQQPQRSSYYYDDDEEDGNYGRPPRNVYAPQRQESLDRLQDDNEAPIVPRPLPPPSNGQEARQRRRESRERAGYIVDDRYNDDDDDQVYDDDEEEYYDDRFYGDDEQPQNYWSNPVRAVDDPPRAKPRTPRRRRTRLPQQKSFVTPMVRDAYERFFWFGFEDDDDDYYSPREGERTIFGGTKGKFNGLSYLNEVEAPNRRRQKRNSAFYDDDDNDYNVDVDEDEEETDYEPFRAQSRRRAPSRYRPLPRQKSFYDNGEYEDAVDDRLGDGRRRSSPSRARRRQEPQTDWNLWDAFLGRSSGDSIMSRERRAAEYDRIMGLKETPPKRPRRPGFTYQYDDPDDDYDSSRRRGPQEKEEDDAIEPPVIEVIDAEPLSPEEEEEQQRNETGPLHWEDRVLAVEQIPPIGIPAWGPEGDLGIDARTKAVGDALEDVREAQAAVRAQDRRLQRAREDVSILRIDAELQRKKLQQDRGISQEEFVEIGRKMDRKVDDAARLVRFENRKLENSLQEMKELETRHWVLLQHFDPDLASEVVEDAIKEIRTLRSDGSETTDV